MVPSSVPALVKVDVFDSDGGTIYSGSDDFLGRASFDLGALCAAAGDDAWADAKVGLTGDAKAKGTLTVSARAYRAPRVKVCEGVRLRNSDGFFGKSDPYAKVMGLVAKGSNWGETVTVRDNLNPTWGEEFAVDLLGQMPLGGKLLPLEIEVWDEDDKRRGPSDDSLGRAALGWKKLWPPADVAGREVAHALKVPLPAAASASA